MHCIHQDHTISHYGRLTVFKVVTLSKMSKIKSTSCSKNLLRSTDLGHLFLYSLLGAYDPDVCKDSLDWKQNQDQAFVSGGLKLVNREIIIPNVGIYFVYTQVSFHISCKNDRTEDQDVVHMSHAVLRYSESYGSYKPLLSALRSTCVHVSEDLWHNTIYLGAAFHLRAGDKLRTETTTKLLHRVENENGLTFLGVFAL